MQIRACEVRLEVDNYDFMLMTKFFVIMLFNCGIISLYQEWAVPANTAIPPPQLTELGTRLRQARLRRGLTMAQVAERADISRETLKRLEWGDGGSLNGLLAVLRVLRLEADLNAIARDDVLGRKLQDLNLPERIRAPRQAG
jgi:DNA-binding XRE family transcriptional regulator